ncbi:MAG: hypothetical protein KC713_06490, partial [Candidatus Omnitrophica bacterium]|nr:hypothetical protein [Candidatus Omnitrophota bacterium]
MNLKLKNCVSALKKQPVCKGFVYALVLTFLQSTFSFELLQVKEAQAQMLFTHQPGMMLTPSAAHDYPVLRAMKVNPKDPLSFQFVIDSGDTPFVSEEEGESLTKYFLTALTLPEEELWVNLSPYEKDRITSDTLSQTLMGKELLIQDYMLKQMSASLSYPESELGQKFWDRVYDNAYKQYGTTDLPMNTYNKVWVVPQTAVVYDFGDSAYVSETYLKVMMDSDYLALKKSLPPSDEITIAGNYPAKDINDLSADIFKELILPEIEKEVNEGEHFASLRQIYHSVILATWFKKRLKEHVLNTGYADQSKLSGVDDTDPRITKDVYDQYLKAFQEGAYKYIKEDYDEGTQSIVPRQYFSGGLGFGVMGAAQADG